MIKHMLRWPNPFKRKPKGYRFPNGIPRVEVTSETPPYSSVIRDLDEYLLGARAGSPWVVFEDVDGKLSDLDPQLDPPIFRSVMQDLGVDPLEPLEMYTSYLNLRFLHIDIAPIRGSS